MFKNYIHVHIYTINLNSSTSKHRIQHHHPSYLTSRRQSEALSSARGAVLGSRTKTSLGKTLPELTLVLTTSKSSISINDSITSLNHVGVARLQSHSIHDKLHGKELSISGNLAVELGENIIVLAMLINQVPHDLVEGRRPDRADGVNASQAVGALVSQGVGGQAGGVGVGADALRFVGDPVAHGLDNGAGVLGLQVDGDGHEVTPSFAHTSRFTTLGTLVFVR